MIHPNQLSDVVNWLWQHPTVKTSYSSIQFSMILRKMHIFIITVPIIWCVHSIYGTGEAVSQHVTQFSQWSNGKVNVFAPYFVKLKTEYLICWSCLKYQWTIINKLEFFMVRFNRGMSLFPFTKYFKLGLDLCFTTFMRSVKGPTWQRGWARWLPSLLVCCLTCVGTSQLCGLSEWCRWCVVYATSEVQNCKTWIISDEKIKHNINILRICSAITLNSPTIIVLK